MNFTSTLTDRETYSGASIKRYQNIKHGLLDVIGQTPFAQRKGVTEYVVFLSALMILLSKYSRKEDIVIESLISGRTRRETESMLGAFINTIALRGRPEKEKTVDDFVEEIGKLCIDAYDNQEYPIEDLMSELGHAGTYSDSSLSNIILTMQNTDYNDNCLGNLNFKTIDIKFDIAKAEYRFDIANNSNGYDIYLEYALTLFEHDTAYRLLERYEEIIKNMISGSDRKIKDITYMNDSERNLILNDFNDTYMEYRKNSSIAELFEKQAEKNHDAVAVSYLGSSYTYGELNRRANIIAHKLRELGVNRNSFVPIIAERSLEMMAGIFGIIKSGGAYVPIDPAYPEERIRYILNDCDPKAILIYCSEAISMPETSEVIIDLTDEETWIGCEENVSLVNTSDDMIYCIYTSGTTGKPKGVPNINRGLINRISWMDRMYPLESDGRILQKTTYTFDVSVWELVWWSLKGASVEMLRPGGEKDPEMICSAIKDGNVTVMHFVPSMLKVFLAYLEENTYEIEKLSSLKYHKWKLVNVQNTCKIYRQRSEKENSCSSGNG